MSLLDCLLDALSSLRTNLLRTALTTLGIIIGVAAVIAMVGVGEGVNRRMELLIETLGANVLIVLNGSSQTRGAQAGAGANISLTEQDAAAIVREAPSVTIAAPTVRGSGQVISGNANWFTAIRGVRNDYLTARDWIIEAGRGFTPAEERSAGKVVILGQTLVDHLFPDQDPIGQTVRIKRVPFTVIGTTKAKGQTPSGTDQDDNVFIPLNTAKRRVLGGSRFRGRYVAAIVVQAATPELVQQAELEVSEVLRRRHRILAGQQDDFSIRNIAQLLETRSESQRTMALLLACVAGISLVVGGIGIMNIMLVTVTERTKEIGLRMAVGARRRDILLQFIIEAVALSLIGGLIGTTLGISGTLLAATLADWPLVLSTLAVALALSFSAAVGVFFGYYPALKASRLDPIEALRHE